MKSRAASPQSAEIEDLIHRARAGERAALEDLLARYKNLLKIWAERQMAGGHHRNHVHGNTGSDILQDSLLRAFQRFCTFEGTTVAELEMWLRKIVDSRAMQTKRHATRKKRNDLRALPLDHPEAQATPIDSPSPSQSVAHVEDWQRVLTFLFELPDKDQQEALWLCHLKELPVSEVAHQMGRTEGSVAGLIQRGIKKLQARMAGAAGGTARAPARVASAVEKETTAALLSYLHQRDRGASVLTDSDIDGLVAQHPACGVELRVMLTWLRRLQSIRPRGGMGASPPA